MADINRKTKELNERTALFEKAAERLAEEQAALKADKEGLKAAKIAFQNRVAAFTKAVTDVVRNA